MRAKTRLLMFLGALCGAFSMSLPVFASVPAPRPAAPTVTQPAVATAAVLSPSRLVVTAGDSLWAIGQAVGRPWPALAAWNHLSDPSLLLPGQVLTVPPAGYVPPVAPAPAPVAAAVRPAPAPTVVAAAASAPVSAASYSPSGVWACIAQHESGGNPAENTGNGFYGAFQFTISSWDGAGGARYASRPDLASYGDQLVVAEALQRMQGWGAWPNTSRMCGV